MVLDNAGIYKHALWLVIYGKCQICLGKGCSKHVAGNGSSLQFCICSQNRTRGLWIHWDSSRKIPTCLIQRMFLQIYPPRYTWAVSTLSMQDCSLCIAALGLLQLLMGVSLEAWRSYICPKQEGYISDWHDILPADRFCFSKFSFLTIGKPTTSYNKTTERDITLALERNLIIQHFQASEGFSAF